jgi:hypothetical protein
VLARLRSLPPDSAYVREASGGWSDDKELSASTLEMLHALYRATLAAAGVKKGSLPKPLTVPRPERRFAEVEPVLPSNDDVLSFFAALTPVNT